MPPEDYDPYRNWTEEDYQFAWQFFQEVRAAIISAQFGGVH